MKFDFVIGNPPYQGDQQGSSHYTLPVYDKFLEAGFELADKVLMIHPARFLFNAGKTSNAWNEKILNDKHFKVLDYEVKSNKIFPNTDIKGGVAITYRDKTKNFGAIKTFTLFPELNAILRKVVQQDNFKTLDDLIIQQNKWNLENLYKDNPEYKNKIGSNGTERRLTTSIFKLEIFHETEKEDDVKILGLIKNKRIYKYINKKYIDAHENLLKYKVIVPASNGCGSIGEVLSTPLIGYPLIGYTQSFIGFGYFNTEYEANSLLKYIKSKFARTFLSILKVTKNVNADTWAFVPLQDFTDKSDIDWTKSIHDIDKQLYKKKKPNLANQPRYQYFH